MESTPHLPGKFVWFEHVSDDVDRARAFYEPLFGWHVESMPMEGHTYTMLMNGSHGIGGLRQAEGGSPNHWLSYLSVDDLDARYRAALDAGATGTLPPTDFPPAGRGAGLVDTTGAMVCLWRSAGGDVPDGDEPPGDFVWNELWAPDDRRALTFYETAFGFTHDAMDMGPDGTYYILKSPDGRGRAGLAKMEMAGVAPSWLPYVRVADCDASLAKAQQLGVQKVLIPGHDIPDVGRIAALIDPLGAAIAMIQPVPMAR